MAATTVKREREMLSRTSMKTLKNWAGKTLESFDSKDASASITGTNAINV
jgi:hypothetical protein